jgi:anti-sigma factor RsiW
MSRCLRERTLWLMSEGEARREDRVHIASCAACRARLRQLEQDLSRLRSVLTAPLPPQAAPARLRPVRVRWMTAAVTLAAAIALVWFGGWWQHPAPPTFYTEGRQESIWPFIEGLSAALFPAVEGGIAGTPDRLSDLTDLQAALAGEWPCDELEAFADLACDDDTFAPLLGGE